MNLKPIADATPEDILREFVQDVNSAAGDTPPSRFLTEDECGPDWPDLDTTYCRAVQVLRRLDKQRRAKLKGTKRGS